MNLRELKVPRAEDYKNVLDELPLNIKNDLEQHLLFLGNERDRLVQEGVETGCSYQYGSMTVRETMTRARPRS